MNSLVIDHSKLIETFGRDALVGEKVAAEIVGLSVKTLQRRRQRREEPKAHKLGGAVRYRIGDLVAYVDGCGCG